MAGVGLGRSRRRGGHDDLPLTAEINVTSLVDVAFTLLVIFIITAPALQGGVEVSLPQADVRPITAMQDLVIVTITAENRIFLEETELSLEDLESSLGQLATAGGWEQLYVRGDSAAHYGPVVRILAAANRAGVAAALIGEPTPRRR